MKPVQNLTWLTLIALGLSLSSCIEEPSKENKLEEAKATHWGYAGESGPEHWAEIEKNSNCGGEFQSPINIVNYSVDSASGKLKIHYSDSTHIHDVINNGHTIQYNFDKGDYVEFRNERFDLLQFHFHEPAEHLIDGIRYPLAIHLVHISDNGHYVVIAAMAKEGESSEPFDFLESYFPISQGEQKQVDRAFDMNQNLPVSKSYFHYRGSLTTPPCSEKVDWIVMKEPITVSLEQVERLRKLMPVNNYRNEQPRNGRRIVLRQL